MKAFDLEKLDTSFRIKIWDRELPDWKDLARQFDLKITVIKDRDLISVMKRVQISAKKRQPLEEIGYILAEAPHVEFEGGARLKKRPKKAKA